MIRIILVLFVAITLATLGCTQDQGQGVFNVDAEITGVGNTILAVKYKIGETIVFDDITMKDNLGILQMIKNSKANTIPLKISIEFLSTDEPKKEGFLKYYYGANYLAESRSFDVDSLIMIADENVNLFTWRYKDGDYIDDDEKKDELKEETPQLKSTTQAPRKEITEKL